MNRIIIYPYKMASASAAILKRELKARFPDVTILRVHPDGRYRPRHGDFILNWGNSNRPDWEERRGMVTTAMLNFHDDVALVIDKRRTFEMLHGTVSVPQSTTDATQAQQWLRVGIPIIARSTVTGSAGRGAKYMEEPIHNLTPYRLFTQYIKKRHEYRVHVFGRDVIDFALKKRKLDVPDSQVDWQIRSHDRGWVFARENVVLPGPVEQAAKSAVAGVGLQFGAVDIVLSTQDERPYVLEINTAPGLEGTTIEKYVNVIARDYEIFCQNQDEYIQMQGEEPFTDEELDALAELEDIERQIEEEDDTHV